MAHSGTTQSAQHCKLFSFKNQNKNQNKTSSYLLFQNKCKKNKTYQSLEAHCVLTGLMVKNDMTVAAELEKFPFGVYVLLPTICNVN